MAQKGMSISEVEGYLTTLESGAVRLDELTEAVGKLQQPLQDCWEGSEAEACVALIGDVSTKMVQMAEEVRKIYKWVEQVKTSYEEAAAAGASAYTI
ncbi:MAG: hypothetical protein E7307_06450 [Butyrivibrio sp.]|nr:hypothetical protein [Butyrivibrio sp.]